MTAIDASKLTPEQQTQLLALLQAQATPTATAAPSIDGTPAEGFDVDGDDDGADGMPLDFDDEEGRKGGRLPSLPYGKEFDVEVDVARCKTLQSEEAGKSWYIVNFVVRKITSNAAELVLGGEYQLWLGYAGVKGWVKRQTKEHIRSIAAACDKVPCTPKFSANPRVKKLCAQDDATKEFPRIRIQCKTKPGKAKIDKQSGLPVLDDAGKPVIYVNGTLYFYPTA